MDKFDIERYKEGLRKASEQFAILREEGRVRKEGFFKLLIPLLEPEAIRQIVEEEKGFYVYYKKQVPSDEDLLRKHLGNLIMEFDANIRWLEDEDMPILAEAINKNPLVIFSIVGGGD